MAAPAQQLAVPPRDTRTDKAPLLPGQKDNAAASAAAAFAAAAAGKQTGNASAASFSFESGLLPCQQANCVEREVDERGGRRASPSFNAIPSSNTRDTNEGPSRSRKRFRCLGTRREESFDSAVAEASDESATERDKSVSIVGPSQAEEEPQQKRPCTLVARKVHAGRVCDAVFFTHLADAVEARRSERSSGADATY
ncbi:hypothetical protein Emag_000754 [Eimeria magna]